MLYQADPFPDPTHAGQEVENIGLMFGAILIMLVLIVLMIYFCKNKEYFLQINVVFLFSVFFSLGALLYGIPFTPNFQVFFILMQSTFYLDYALSYFKDRKKRKRGY